MLACLLVYKLLEKVANMRINHVIKTDQWRAASHVRSLRLLSCAEWCSLRYWL